MHADRQWSLDIGGEPFISTQVGTRQFRIVFDVQVTPGNALVLADIRIYNLARDTKINRNASIILRAGYVDACDTIFNGYITNVFREREGTDIITRLVCKSGNATTDRGSANGSYGKNARLVDVLKDLAYSWPRELRMDESQFADAPLFTSGFVANGDIPSILDKLAYEFDFDWVLDRGSLVVMKRGAERMTPVNQINQFTGMIGIPEVTLGPGGIDDKAGLGVFVAHKLDPYFFITDRFEIKSEFATFNTGNMYIVELGGEATANGIYNFFQLRYRGDSWGDQWVVEINGIRALSTAEQTVTTPTGRGIIWGAKVDQPFRVKVREVAQNLGFDPNWLMAVMAFETGRTFSPSKKNPGSSATGLIQFVESTAKGLGTSTRELSRMSAVQQLDYVQKYYEPYKRKVKNLGDAYMAVLWPAAMGKPDSYIMWTREANPQQYNANSGLDLNRDGKITRGEAVARVNREMNDGAKYVK